jgi:hypothetical protein
MVKKDMVLVNEDQKNKTTIKKQKNKIIKKSIENWTWRSVATFVGYLILKNNIK